MMQFIFQMILAISFVVGTSIGIFEAVKKNEGGAKVFGVCLGRAILLCVLVGAGAFSKLIAIPQ